MSLLFSRRDSSFHGQFELTNKLNRELKWIYFPDHHRFDNSKSKIIQPCC